MVQSENDIFIWQEHPVLSHGKLSKLASAIDSPRPGRVAIETLLTMNNREMSSVQMCNLSKWSGYRHLPTSNWLVNRKFVWEKGGRFKLQIATGFRHAGYYYCFLLGKIIYWKIATIFWDLIKKYIFYTAVLILFYLIFIIFVNFVLVYFLIKYENKLMPQKLFIL